MKKLCLLSLVVSGSALLTPLAAPEVAVAQTLRRASRTVRGSGRDNRTRRRADRRRNERRNEARNERRDRRRNRSRRRGGSRAADAIAIQALIYPFFGPVFATGDRWGPEWWLADHPYADGVEGYAVYLPIDEADASSPPVQDVAVSTSVEGGYVFGDVARGAVEVRTMLPHRLEIDVTGTVLGEPEAVGSWTWVGMETLHLGLRFSQDANWQFHVGLGARVLHDVEGAVPGFDFRYQVDVFPVRPLVVSVRLSMGNLDRAMTLEGRFTLGLVAGPVEFFVGYHHLSLLDLEDASNSVNLSGPVGGLRTWI